MNLANPNPRPHCATRKTALSDSLSIIVPVRNAERKLPAHLGRLLDLLPDLTHRFEIVVVDDASTDHTVDLARDLSRELPQIRLIRHPAPQGLEAAIKTGERWAQGQTVICLRDLDAVSDNDLRRQWALRQQASPAAHSQPGVFDPRLLQRLANWGQSLRSFSGIALAQQGRADEAHSGKLGLKRHGATFLKHLRDLALGE
jgi:glycosyltransferase involved in cell wall biosynthesis